MKMLSTPDGFMLCGKLTVDFLSASDLFYPNMKSMSRRTQNVEIYLANEASVLAFFSTDLGHIFGSNVGNEFGVMLRGKGPHQPEFAYNIVRIHYLMIYTDLIESNIVGDTKAPLLRCFPFISKLKTGDIIATGQ